jgi:hypothetical protein
VASIGYSIADANMSVIDGSIGAIPRRIMVVEDRLDDARRLLADADIPTR